MHEPTFGDLRSALQRAPSPFVWDELTWILERLGSSELRERALPYALDHLARWPDALRVLPQRWKADLGQGQVQAALPIARELQFNEFGALPLDAAARWRVLEHPATAQLTRYNFHYANLSDADLIGLSHHERLRDVQALNLTSTMSVGQPGFAALFARAGLTQLRELRLGGCLAAGQQLHALLLASWAPDLRELDLQTTRPPLELLSHVLRAAVTWGWRGLDLSNMPEVAPALEWLLSQPAVALESLGLATCALDEDLVQRLLRSPGLASLRHVELGRNKLSALTFEALADAEHLRLESLRMGGNSYLVRDPYTSERGFERSYRSFERFCAAAHLRQLRLLKLLACDLDEPALLRLAHATFLGQLEELNLSNNALGHSGVEPLLSAQPMPKLRVLSLSRCDLRTRAIRALAEARSLRGLEVLDLSANPIKPEGFWALARSSALRGLRSLDLSSTDPDDDALIELLESPVMSTVQDLGLRHIKLSGAVIEALSSSPHCARLQTLRCMPQTFVSRAKREHLARSTTLHPRLLASILQEAT